MYAFCTCDFAKLVKIFYLKVYDLSLQSEFILYISCSVKKVFLTTLGVIMNVIENACRRMEERKLLRLKLLN